MHLITYWNCVPFFNFLRTFLSRRCDEETTFQYTRRGAIYRLRLDFPIFYGMGYTKIFELNKKYKEAYQHRNINSGIKWISHKILLAILFCIINARLSSGMICYINEFNSLQKFNCNLFSLNTSHCIVVHYILTYLLYYIIIPFSYTHKKALNERLIAFIVHRKKSFNLPKIEFYA